MINILPADVYNRIAAGEVVDRPYSVVKELVENAVDAGASEITVEIEESGKKLIRVTDNGCGIEKSDLKSAFLPHATSKLKCADDLAAITTLGFRGEAIASIAAVSRMTIASKTKEGEAWSLTSEGGVLGTVCPAGSADGTVVSVESLFSNTPARLKFLKSDTQEEGDVSNMMARFLLSRPTIAFTYLVNGKVRYRSFGDGLESAVAVVYGADTLKNCFRLEADKHGISLKGYIGDRNFAKPNRSYQSLFVNGRYVVNQTVSAAIANAYRSYLMTRQYPFYVLFLDLPPEIVDVNVHPNKADVRFADNQIVYGTVYSVLSSVLDGNSRALDYLVSSPARGGEPIVRSTAKNEGKGSAAPLPMSYSRAKEELRFDVSPVGGSPRLFPPRTPNLLEVRSNETEKREPEEDAFEENRRLLLERERAGASQPKLDPATLVYKGELFRTYLFYECGDEAYLIDQHAAHERLLYDRLKKRLESKQPLSQPMLLPYLLHVNAQEYAFLVKNLELLRGFGFEIEDFGGNSMKVSAVPLDLFGMDLAAFFNEVLSSMESLRAIKLADLVKDRLATMACKAAVKGGELLTEDEARSLVREMDGDMSLHCPHGRPACVRIKKTELEKLFKRIV